ncbi:MAG: hypothetical protein NPIRA02_00810 [Nitrospirales bacterium]|nr:MAG: hypothetical protein NPIRA02_00810 [Nitrospirales bacterium]
MWLGQMSIKWSIEKPFFIDQFESTVGEYKKYLDSLGRVPKRDLTPAYLEQAELPRHADFPVVGVTWRQASLYCKAMGKRLPTGAEWKMAAVRKGNEKAGPGDLPLLDLDQLGKSQSSTKIELPAPFFVYEQGLRKVGSNPEDVSAYGVNDMASSVSEWLAWTNKESNARDLIGRLPKILGPASFSNTLVEDHGGRFWLGFRCAKDIAQ